MNKQYFILSTDRARVSAIDAIKSSPEGYCVEIKQPSRSLEQNAMLHSIIQQIARTIEWAGKKRSVEVWKRLLTAAWLRARGDVVELLPAIDGHGVDIVFRRTSELTVGEMIELLEYVQSWAIEQGIEI